MQILGVRVDNVSLREAEERARQFLNTPGGHKIFTPNPEMLVKAHSDADFSAILNMGHLNLIDGFGLELACLYKYRKWPKRIPGVDFVVALCKIASEMGKSVYLLGSGRDEVARRAGETLAAMFPNLKIVGADAGPEIIESATDWDVDAGKNAEAVARVNRVNPDIIFAAFGMGKQEKWIARNLPALPSVRIAMGVGGSLDYLSGNIRRAPLFLRKIGLEWLYRLFRQPHRLRRIWRAVVLFPWLVLTSKHYYESEN